LNIVENLLLGHALRSAASSDVVIDFGGSLDGLSFRHVSVLTEGALSAFPAPKHDKHNDDIEADREAG
jgi:hypothetical protein